LTPYFLPDQSLITALNLAVLRGVQVDIILPSVSNLPYVHWASRAMWWQVLERGCRVWLTPPPFDHSKLMIVDNHWVFLGSAGWAGLARILSAAALTHNRPSRRAGEYCRRDTFAQTPGNVVRALRGW